MLKCSNVKSFKHIIINLKMSANDVIINIILTKNKNKTKYRYDGNVQHIHES